MTNQAPETPVAPPTATRRVTLKQIILALANPIEAGRLFAIWVIQNLLGDLAQARTAAAALFVVLTTSIALRMLGLDVFYWLPSTKALPDVALNLPVLRSFSAIEDTKHIRDCAVQARKAGQRYLILGAAEYQRIEQDRQSKARSIDHRIGYTILPFADMTAAPTDTGFDEIYATGGRLISWGGPFDETSTVPGRNRTAYRVLLNAKRGIPMTLMTGTNKRFDPGFVPANRQGHSFDRDHDFYHYENAADEICSYAAVFDSESLVLSPLSPELTGEDAKDGRITIQAKNKLIVDYEPYNFPNSTFAMVVSDFRPKQDAFVSWGMQARPIAVAASMATQVAGSTK